MEESYRHKPQQKCAKIQNNLCKKKKPLIFFWKDVFSFGKISWPFFKLLIFLKMDFGKIKRTFMNKNLKERNFKIQSLFQNLFF